jgi:hypothetical protein
MTEDVLTFTRNNVLADLKPQESDVAIALGQEPSLVGDNLLWLHGTYQIDEAYGRQLNVQPLQKVLVITWASDGTSATKNLVGDVVLFGDDEEMCNNMCVGHFNYDLADWLNMYERRKYFITVSLGRFISNTLEVEVNPVPISE